LAADIDFLIHTTQHKNKDEVYDIRRILGEKRDATGRWLFVDRHPERIDKEQATLAEVAIWEEYKRMDPDGDRVFEHLETPFEVPTILKYRYACGEEPCGYIRTFSARYERAGNIHRLLLEQWEDSDEFDELAFQNGWWTPILDNIHI